MLPPNVLAKFKLIPWILYQFWLSKRSSFKSTRLYSIITLWKLFLFFVKHVALRSSSKDLLAWNQENVLEWWSNRSTCQTVVSVSYHYKNPTKQVGPVQNKHDLVNLFLQWYWWKITHSVLNNKSKCCIKK